MSRQPRPVRVGGVVFGGGARSLIAGPCVIEGRAETLASARAIARICADARFQVVFKASFDKANRTSIRSFRGPGLKAGLDILREVKEVLGLPVITDVHEVRQVEAAAEVVDCIQIPAFLCRQTDLIVGAASTGLPVNIKKGQFMSPESMAHAVEKARSAGGGGVMLTERGVSFGYNTLVVDFRSIVIMRDMGVPVIFDATHSVQSPGGKGCSSGGDRRFVLPLSRAAAAVGVDGVFVEVHRNPEDALSDGPNSIDYTALKKLLGEISAVGKACGAEPRRSAGR